MKVLSSLSKMGGGRCCGLLQAVFPVRRKNSLKPGDGARLPPTNMKLQPPGQMAVAYAVFQYQTAVLEIYSNHMPIAKSIW